MSRRNTNRWRTIGTFLLFTFAFSTPFYALIIAAGSGSIAEYIYKPAMMWCPGLAALATLAIYRESVRDLGWQWGRRRFVLWGYLLPVLYAAPVYMLIWGTGLRGFPNWTLIEAVENAFRFREMHVGLTVALLVVLLVLSATAGLVIAAVAALGEEIGWRGFLQRELNKLCTAPRAPLVVGLIWAAWHYPLLLSGINGGQTPGWVRLPCFTILAVALSFQMAWLWLRSGSIWPAVLLHASHNFWVQGVFDPLTIPAGHPEYIIGEFGVGLAISSTVCAVILYWVAAVTAEENVQRG